MLAQYLGIDLLGQKKSEPAYGQMAPKGGLSIAEIAAKITPPIAGGETLASSFEVFKAMHEGSGS